VSNDAALYEYAMGPVNKNEETHLFENIVKEVIADKTRVPKQAQFTKDGNVLYVKHNGEKINFSELLSKVNLTQMSLDSESVKAYENDGTMHAKSPSREVFAERIAQADVKQQQSLGKLKYGEMLAVFKYTTESYKPMNALMRGQHADLAIKDIPDLVAHVAVASYALTKVPDIELPYVVRNQDTYGLNKMLEKAQTHEVSVEQSFISTAMSSQKDFNGGVQVIYKNVHGKSISAISEIPYEEEYLIPPSTQLQWTGHQVSESGQHVFTVEGANVLLEERHKSPSFTAAKEMNELVESSLQKLENKTHMSKSDIKEFVYEIIEISERQGIISESEKEAYYAKDTKGVSRFDKDIEAISNVQMGMKDRMLHSISRVSNTMGLNAINHYVNKKITKDVRKQLAPSRATFEKLKESMKTIATKEIRAQVQPASDKQPVVTGNAKTKDTGQREL